MALFPGNPLVEPLTQFTGVGATFAQAVDNFKNLAQTTIRTINWDGVKTDGTDSGGPPNTTVIPPVAPATQSKTVGIPLNRFQTQGVFFEQVYAVSSDGFVDVNPNVAALFPAFSSPNTFAMFNDNTIDQSFVLPSAVTTTPVPAATRGFGAIFINVQTAGMSSIEYFSGDKSLGTVFVPVGAQGQPEFAGALFPDAVVTRVTLTLGTDVLFTFDGSTTTGTTTNNPPTHNLVVTDDFLIAEPVQIAPTGSFPPVLSGAQGTLKTQPEVNTTVGTSFTGTVATFSDTAAGSGPQNYTAVINWGDGTSTNGTVGPSGSGGFNVVGTHTFNTAGLVPLSVDVQKFDIVTKSISLTNTALVAQASTTTTLTVSPTSGVVGQPITLTAKVTGTTTPNGLVEFKDGSTSLGVATLDNTGTAILTTSGLKPGTHNLTASYLGNNNFTSSDSSPVSTTISSTITSQVVVVRGPVRRRRGGGFNQVVTLTANGTFFGPIFLVFDNSTKAKPSGASGVTRNQSPPGSPFIIVPIGSSNTFASGQQIVLNLVFNARSAKLVNTYTPRVLAGVTP